MKPVRRVALVVGLGIAALGVGLAAGDVGARPKKPAVVEAPPPPPPPPPMPNVGLGERFIEDAAAYAGYLRETEGISPAFADAPGVARSLRVGVAYEPTQFQRGELAYAAVAALQDRTFVAAVRAAGQTPEARYAIVTKIYADPANVLKFADAATAEGLAKQALANDGMRLLLLGKAVRKEAYDIQHQAWSKDDVANPDARLAAAKALSTSARIVADADAAQIRAEVAPDQASAAPLEPVPPPYSPLVVRATALAALAAIGQAGDADAPHLGWLSQDYFTEHCLEHAKKELNECLAVAKPNYEDIFCLGQPSMMYTGECLVKGAGSTIPLDISTQPFPIPPVHHAVRRRRR